MSDLGSLALVIDDPLASRLVAYWKTKAPMLADFDALAFQRQVATSCRTRDLDELRTAFENCKGIGLLLDGGISPLAENWLKANVAQRLGVKPQVPKAPKQVPVNAQKAIEQ